MRYLSQFSIRKRIFVGIIVIIVFLTAFIYTNRAINNNNNKKMKGSVDEEVKFSVNNIFAATGSDIDYFDNVDIDGAFSISVDSSAVDTNIPGKYTVVYTVNKDNKIESETAYVTIREDKRFSKVQKKEVQSDETTRPTENIDNADIVLSTGSVVTVKCTTNRYITSTITNSYEVDRNDGKYCISELIVKFNTGEERVLETIQKKID